MQTKLAMWLSLHIWYNYLVCKIVLIYINFSPNTINNSSKSHDALQSFQGVTIITVFQIFNTENPTLKMNHIKPNKWRSYHSYQRDTAIYFLLFHLEELLKLYVNLFYRFCVTLLFLEIFEQKKSQISELSAILDFGGYACDIISRVTQGFYP